MLGFVIIMCSDGCKFTLTCDIIRVMSFFRNVIPTFHLYKTYNFCKNKSLNISSRFVETFRILSLTF